MLASKFVNPVTLPPGRARFGTMPEETGSATFTNTIGMVLVARRSAIVGGVDLAKSISGLKAINSLADASASAMLAPDQRYAIAILRPSLVKLSGPGNDFSL